MVAFRGRRSQTKPRGWVGENGKWLWGRGLSRWTRERKWVRLVKLVAWERATALLGARHIAIVIAHDAGMVWWGEPLSGGRSRFCRKASEALQT